MTDSLHPKVSVIISCYKGERYLEKFLDKIVEQTWFDKIEFIMDHNCPSQKELQIIKDFTSEHPGRLKHFVREQVVPYGASWNKCIIESSADIIANWNVDDVRTRDSIEIQARPILEDEADLVFGDYTKVNHFGSEIGERISVSQIDPYYYSRKFCFGPFLMFNKNICKKIGYFDEQLRSGSDFDFGIRAALFSRIKVDQHDPWLFLG